MILHPMLVVLPLLILFTHSLEIVAMLSFDLCSQLLLTYLKTRKHFIDIFGSFFLLQTGIIFWFYVLVYAKDG